MADSNDFLLGSTPAANAIPPELQQAIANSLRNRDSMGAIMALSGNRAVAPVGEQFMQSAQVQRQQLLNHRYYQGMLEQQKAAMAERAREANQAFGLGMAKVGATDRATAARVAKSKPVPSKLVEPLIVAGASLRSMDELNKGWKDEWHSSIPGMNVLKSTIARVAPDFASQSSKDYYAWRQQFIAQLESMQRHQLYGGALTYQEINYWKKQMLDEAASPEQVHNFFNKAQKYLNDTTQARIAGGSHSYNPQELMDYVNGTVQAAPTDEGPSPQEQEMNQPDFWLE